MREDIVVAAIVSAPQGAAMACAAIATPEMPRVNHATRFA